ncbi:inositol monophosphatase family protein [Micromonospora sp. C95]|uniref:inositol monophosphatase family protein n=1 Tax=Micromonospora sp. C95 TaxID=2824882 RepID=UPI001B383C71|nr:inositol monophosphatase family protein [Micromonospora sp. C95]MBQ1023548.1 inositol monophosphatase family protein [Micromonospora sp. C95]
MSLVDADLAIRAAQAGAEVVRSHHGRSVDRFAKADGDFATTADIEAEQAILGVLRSARPDDAMVAEESGRSGSDRNGRVWLVDPLCGTLNFAVHTTLVSVNVALRVGAEVTAAAVVDPFAQEVFWTDGTAARVRCGGVDQHLVPSAASGLVDVNLDPPFPNERLFRAVRLLAHEGFVERFRPRVVSTTLALAWVAAGRRAAYVTDGRLHDSVHFAAGIALCEAAGCVVTGLDGQPWRSGLGGLVAAADADTHAGLLALIKEQREPA